MLVFICLIVCFSLIFTCAMYTSARTRWLEKELETDTANLDKQHKHEVQLNREIHAHEERMKENNPYGMN
jgi:predicted Holliday junction resolvase-like endonuclease